MNRTMTLFRSWVAVLALFGAATVRIRQDQS